MAGNIIPAIATTNAMTAGLCVLQAFKIMRDDLQKARMVFLTRSIERITFPETLRPPRPDCPVCGVANASIRVDTTKATLGDLVDGVLRKQWNYGEELSVSSDAGVLYEPDLEDNLGKTFKELGVGDVQFLTVVDDALENPKLNLVLALSAKEVAEDPSPLIAPQKVEIPLRPPTDAPAVMNGVNGEASAPAKRKREADEAELEEEQTKKRGKVVGGPATVPGDDDDVLLAEDPNNNFILILD